MLSRRKFVSGLIAAPAIIRPAKAAFWQGQTFAQGGSGFAGAITSDLVGPNMTQIKPQGIPRINPNHPLAFGLVAFLFDLGSGQYINLCPGNAAFNQSDGPNSDPSGVPQALVNGSNAYGAMTLWPGLTVQQSFSKPGVSALIQLAGGLDLSIPNANDLASKGVGAGNTLACGLIRLPGTVNADQNWIFGRPGISAGEVSPFYDWCFEQSPNTNSISAQCLTTGPSAVQVGSNFSCPDNVYVGLHMVVQNTSASPGTGPGRFLANGALNGTTSGISMTSYNPASNAETDLMIGCNKHLQTTETVNVFNGYLPWGAVYWYPMPDTLCDFQAKHPYSLFYAPS